MLLFTQVFVYFTYRLIASREITDEIPLHYLSLDSDTFHPLFPEAISPRRKTDLHLSVSLFRREDLTSF